MTSQQPQPSTQDNLPWWVKEGPEVRDQAVVVMHNRRVLRVLRVVAAYAAVVEDLDEMKMLGDLSEPLLKLHASLADLRAVATRAFDFVHGDSHWPTPPPADGVRRAGHVGIRQLIGDPHFDEERENSLTPSSPDELTLVNYRLFEPVASRVVEHLNFNSERFPPVRVIRGKPGQQIMRAWRPIVAPQGRDWLSTMLVRLVDRSVALDNAADHFQQHAQAPGEPTALDNVVCERALEKLKLVAAGRARPETPEVPVAFVPGARGAQLGDIRTFPTTIRAACAEVAREAVAVCSLVAYDHDLRVGRRMRLPETRVPTDLDAARAGYALRSAIRASDITPLDAHRLNHEPQRAPVVRRAQEIATGHGWGVGVVRSLEAARLGISAGLKAVPPNGAIGD